MFLNIMCTPSQEESNRLNPFHAEPGIHKFGDTEFEWRSLLSTPCYGFSGPNACYSSTCKHNGLASKPKKSFAKGQFTAKSSSKFNFNGKKSTNCERGGDKKTYKRPLPLHLVVNAFDYGATNGYTEYHANFNGDFYVGGISESNLFYDESIDETKDLNQFADSCDYLRAMNNLSAAKELNTSNGPSRDSRDDDDLAKKYQLNPLSKPFQPQSVYTCDGYGSPLNDSITAKYEALVAAVGANKRSKRFVCILCPEKFFTSDELRKHLISKVEERFMCIICGTSFADKHVLQRHFQNHRSSKQFRCRGCSNKFRSFNQLRKHFEVCPYKLHMCI